MKTRVGVTKLISMFLWVAFILALIILLGGYAYRGVFSRYLQDDYCYGAQTRGADFIAAQVDSYMRVMPYNSDRYALTLFSGFAEVLGGPRFVPFLPGLSLVLWAGALWLALGAWQKAFQVKVGRLASLAAALGLLFFVLYLAPNLYQVLFWRSAMFPYLTPLVIDTFLVAGFFTLIRKGRVVWWQALLLFVAAFIAGGFSETVAAWQGCLWGLLLVFYLLRAPRRGYPFGLLAIPLLGTLLAILVMALGPGNSTQLSPFKRPDLAALVTQPLRYAWDFIYITLRLKTLPFAAVAVLGFLAGVQAGQETNLSFWHAARRLLAIVISGYLSVLSVMLPTTLAMSSPPGDRALLPAYFTLVIAVCAGSWTVARFLATNRIWDGERVAFQAGAALLALCILGYVLTAAPAVLSNLSAYQQRAAAWDMRDAQIRQAAADGVNHVVVPAFDSIAFIFELYPQENFWVNVCAARYYGVAGISAVEGYNGVSPIFR